ncbi:DUF2589 domain-containing protein [Rahnella victoriana]|uniref:DUF2589 domain-containing protein n=1 Tax=Rahnella victoriana TaxID=1510570 RepID=UPI000BB17F5D|nr:DUF2589 domain-containing protein [Rahnella victoriana]
MSLKSWLRGGKASGETPPGNPVPPAGGSEYVPPGPGGLMPVSLEEVTRGMQQAASAANQLIAHQYMQALDPFFEHLDDGSLVPRTMIMQLDDNHHFELPLVALSTPRGLMLEKMKVHLTIRTDGVEQLPIEGGEGNVSRFQVSLSPASKGKEGRDSRHVDIEMQFTVLEPPESVMRLIDEYTNRVIPVPNNKEVPKDE